MTERKQSEKNDERPAITAQVNVLEQIHELRKSEEVYRSLVESTEDSVYLVDRDCRYLFMSDKHLSRLGLPAGQVIGTTYGELHSPEDAKELAEKVNQVFETGTSIRHEHRSRRDNRYILRTLSPVKEPDGKVTAVTVVSKDITAMKQTEKELIETKDYLDNIINSSADTITVVDLNGIVRDWNKGANGFMGYRADEVIGRPNSILFADPEDADRIQELVRREGEIKTIGLSR
ncbi:PAS domain-containing protein [Candidatus Methanophagaceae archaeon]|jgi:PAS domain S-box-containing protein|nr:PAS domain-containing protein [Methanophagales archaeon]